MLQAMGSMPHGQHAMPAFLVPTIAHLIFGGCMAHAPRWTKSIYRYMYVALRSSPLRGFYLVFMNMPLMLSFALALSPDFIFLFRHCQLDGCIAMHRQRYLMTFAKFLHAPQQIEKSIKLPRAHNASACGW